MPIRAKLSLWESILQWTTPLIYLFCVTATQRALLWTRRPQRWGKLITVTKLMGVIAPASNGLSRHTAGLTPGNNYVSNDTRIDGIYENRNGKYDAFIWIIYWYTTCCASDHNFMNREIGQVSDINATCFYNPNVAYHCIFIHVLPVSFVMSTVYHRIPGHVLVWSCGHYQYLNRNKGIFYFFVNNW